MCSTDDVRREPHTSRQSVGALNDRSNDRKLRISSSRRPTVTLRRMRGLTGSEMAQHVTGYEANGHVTVRRPRRL